MTSSHALHRYALVAAVAANFLSAANLACRLPPPGTTAGTVINCAATAVKDNFAKILPGANTCLGDAADYESCLLALINPVAGVTEDVLACVLRDQGPKFGDAAARNPGDTRSARAAQRAQSFMNKRGYVFAVEPPQ